MELSLERQLTAILDAALDAVVGMGTDGRITYWNPRAEVIFGWSRGEAIGRPLAQLIIPERFREAHQQSLRRFLVSGEGRILGRKVELAALRRDGTEFPVELTVIALGEGDARAFHAFIADISERKRAEEALKASEQHFRALIENSSDAIALFSRGGEILYGSPATARILGWPEEEFVGRDAFELIHPEDRPLVRERLAESLARPAVGVPVHARVLHRDGAWRFLEGIFTNLLHEPSVGAIVNNYRDLSERHRAEAALRESEARYRNLFDSVAEAVLTLDLELRIEDANGAFESLFGHRLADVRGGDSAILWAAEKDYDRFQRGLAATETRARLREQPRLRTRDGRVFRAEVTIFPRLADGELVGYAGLIRDVTREGRLEEQLRQAQKMEAMGRLAGGIAHDFNNLLTAMLGYSELLREQAGADPAWREGLDHVLDAGRRAAALVRQLLAFGRQQTMEPEDLDLNEVVGGLEGMLRRLSGEAVEMSVRLNPVLGRVEADRGQLEQVLINLVVNARDAMPRGGTLVIETSNAVLGADDAVHRPQLLEGRYVVLSVRDDGVGMDALILSRLFEPFFTTKDVGKGTGLGLATAYGIVKQSGGEIVVESAAGRGARFDIYLPRVDTRSRPAAGAVQR